jgi:hypothetical protein
MAECPFYKEPCRNDCAFHSEIAVALNYGEKTNCKLVLAAQYFIDKAGSESEEDY